MASPACLKALLHDISVLFLGSNSAKTTTESESVSQTTV